MTSGTRRQVAGRGTTTRAIAHVDDGRHPVPEQIDAIGQPDLWPQFIALGQFPALVIRGANSDLLSAETVETMVERHPNLRTLTVPGQGHAPVLNEPETVEVIGSFLAAND